MPSSSKWSCDFITKIYQTARGKKFACLFPGSKSKLCVDLQTCNHDQGYWNWCQTTTTMVKVIEIDVKLPQPWSRLLKLMSNYHNHGQGYWNWCQTSTTMVKVTEIDVKLPQPWSRLLKLMSNYHNHGQGYWHWCQTTTTMVKVTETDVKLPQPWSRLLKFMSNYHKNVLESMHISERLVVFNVGVSEALCSYGNVTVRSQLLKLKKKGCWV